MSGKVPPDGGWGWMIMIASSLNGLSVVVTLQGFGLIFKDALTALGLSAMDISMIINVNMSLGMLVGLVNGPLLKNYGYRKVTLGGCTLFTTGMILTAFANNYVWFMFSYGILVSIGAGLATSAFSQALNSYFLARRSRAVGLSATIIGIGPIVMPQVVSVLLSHYGLQGTVLLFGSHSLHSFIGVTLLQPIKWHMRKVSSNLENVNEDDVERPKKDTSIDNQATQRLQESKIGTFKHNGKCKNRDVEIGNWELSEPPNVTSFERSISVLTHGSSILNLSEVQIPARTEETWWNLKESTNSINLNSCANIFDESAPYVPLNDKSKDSIFESRNDDSANDKNRATRSTLSYISRRIVAFYDLELLRDPIYVNILVGASMATFAEINFSMFTPFILFDMGLSVAEVANVMSTIATVDLIMRFVASFVGEWCRQSARNMYLYSLILLIITRSSLMLANGYTQVAIVAVGLGLAKGIRTVYMVLVMPNYVPIHRLPFATGMQMILNGILLLTVGPFIGVLRDITGSYRYCIIMINTLTTFTVTLWILEKIVLSLKRKVSTKEDGRSLSFRESRK